MWFEVPKDVERKLSFTFSVDVVKFILANLEAPFANSSFNAVNVACAE